MITFLSFEILAWIFVALYVFSCITLWQIGKKMGVGKAAHYFVPVYNLVLTCRCAGVSAWNVLATFVPLLNFGAMICVWGNLARRMGKSFWLYGLTCPLLYFPILILAFGGAMPIRETPLQETYVKGVNPTPPIHLEARDSDFEMECVQGELQGERIGIPTGEQNAIVIGRNPQTAHLVIKHPQVSGSHARLWSEPGSNGSACVRLLDMNSTNGTQFLTAHQKKWETLRGGEATLRDGDAVRISNVVQFRISHAGRMS